MPRNYYRDDDPAQLPIVGWRAHGDLLFTNWLNYCVYQETPYDLHELGAGGTDDRSGPRGHCGQAVPGTTTACRPAGTCESWAVYPYRYRHAAQSECDHPDTDAYPHGTLGPRGADALGGIVTNGKSPRTFHRASTHTFASGPAPDEKERP